MDLLDYASAVRRRWLVVVALLLLGAIGGTLYGLRIPDSYRSSSSVFVTAQQGDDAQQAFQGNQYSVAAVQSYVRLATLPKVLAPVISKLHLTTTPTQLARQLTVEAQTDTVIIDITATASSSAASANIAEAVADSLVTQASALAPKTSKKTPLLTLSIVADAAPPAAPFAPNRTLFTILGLLIGLALGSAYAVGRQMFGTKITSEDDLAKATELPILGRISRLPRRVRLAMQSHPHGAAAEDYRRLRTNLEFADVDNAARLVVVTSAMPGDGKSTTALNLALAMAESRSRVLLLDGDLRKPTVADYLQIDGGIGLTSVLIGRSTLDEAVQTWGTTGLDVLPSGEIAPNPNQLIGSDSMRNLLEEVRGRYDHVIVDAAPVLAVTDTLSMADVADGVLVVTLNRVTRRADLERTLESLRLVQARTLGIVLNQTATASRATYGYTQGERSKRAAAARTPEKVRLSATTTR